MKKYLVCSSVLMLAACGGGFNSANKEFYNNFTAGQYETAGNIMSQATIKNEKPNNEYLGGLQCGTAYLWTANADNTAECFLPVDDIITGKKEENSSYTIKNYEKIMFKTYEAANLLAKEDKYAKQVFNQAYDLQRTNITDSSSEIQDARKEYAEAQEKLKESGVNNVPNMDSLASTIAAQMNDAENSVVPMKNFANPYTTWMMALYDGANGDMGNAKNGMNKVQQFAPNNTFISKDIQGLSKGSIYVVLENGMVGKIKERSLVPEALKPLTQPLAAIGVNAGIKLTIPDVFPGTKAVEHISVKTDKQTVDTQLLANMDSVVKADFDKYKTGHIMSAIAFEVGKIAVATAAGIAANEAAKGSSFRGLATVAAVTAVMSVNKPWDLRSWNSIPNEVQTARVDMPKDRTIIINDNFEITIPEGIKNAIVFVRIPSAIATPGVVIGKLN